MSDQLGASEAEPAPDWMKLFDDGTARLGRSLFLAVMAGLAVMIADRVDMPGEAECPGGIATWLDCARAWFAFASVHVSVPVLFLLFIVQFGISFPSYLQAASAWGGAGGRKVVSPARTVMWVLLGIIGATLLAGVLLASFGAIASAIAPLAEVFGGSS